MRKAVNVNYEVLAKAIYEIIEEFGPYHSPRNSKAMKIVKIITNTMTDGLRRGEDVKIMGLGIFRLVHIPARLKTIYYFEAKTPSRKLIPAHLTVRFFPSKVLKRSLKNEQNSV